MARPPALSPSPLAILIDRLNVWLRHLADATDKLEGGHATLVAGKALGVTGSSYLEDAFGTALSATHGFVMPKAGSIVACSVNLTVSAVTAASLVLEVRVNDVPKLTATKAIPVTGVYSWYATSDRHIHKFAAGDLIQFKLTVVGTSCSKAGVLAIAAVRFDT
jgi:hypothetical protein